MKFYKLIENGFIVSVGSTTSDKLDGNSNEPEYNAIMQKIQNKPADPEGYQHKLRADTLEWELVELPPVESEPMTNEEALTRYSNEITGANDPDLISAAETLITERIKEEH